MSQNFVWHQNHGVAEEREKFQCLVGKRLYGGFSEEESADGSFHHIGAKSCLVLKEARCELWVTRGGVHLCVCVCDIGGMQGIGHISAWRVTCPKVEVACERVKSHG